MKKADEIIEKKFLQSAENVSFVEILDKVPLSEENWNFGVGSE